MRLPIAREGVPLVLVCTLLALVAVHWARSGGWGLRAAVPAALGAAALFVLCFFRDPERTIPPGEDIVVSPADGKVMSVELVVGEGFMGGTATRITIFLSVFNVHVQRAPLAGHVEHYAYRSGGFLPAWRDDASHANERASLGIGTPAGPVLVRQIAGTVARRIVTYPREGDRVAKGDRLGLIRFGSRVDLFLPPEWPVAVAPGDVVRGGETVVARIGRDTDGS